MSCNYVYIAEQLNYGSFVHVWIYLHVAMCKYTMCMSVHVLHTCMYMCIYVHNYVQIVGLYVT